MFTPRTIGGMVGFAILVASCASPVDQTEPPLPTTPESTTTTVVPRDASSDRLPVGTTVDAPHEAAVEALMSTPSIDEAAERAQLVELSTHLIAQEIHAAYVRRWDGYWGCLRAPMNCDTSYLIEDGPAWQSMHANMQVLADRDRYVGVDPVGSYTILSIDVDDDGQHAEVVVCWWSTAVLYGAPVNPTRPVGPDNPATLANNTPSAGHQTDYFRRDDDGVWRLEWADSFGDSFPYDVCG